MIAEFLQRHGLKSPCCGAEDLPGWEKILDSLVVDLKALGWDGDVHQIKEKFGGLRFYIGGGNDAIRTRVAQAENESFKVCEECGAPGKRRTDRGWIKTRCEGCAG